MSAPAALLQVLGGTGRVGGSTAEALLGGGDPSLQVFVVGRSEETYRKASKRRPRLSGAHFQQCDIDDPKAVKVIRASSIGVPYS